MSPLRYFSTFTNICLDVNVCLTVHSYIHACADIHLEWQVCILCSKHQTDGWSFPSDASLCPLLSEPQLVRVEILLQGPWLWDFPLKGSLSSWRLCLQDNEPDYVIFRFPEVYYLMCLMFIHQSLDGARSFRHNANDCNISYSKHFPLHCNLDKCLKPVEDVWRKFLLSPALLKYPIKSLQRSRAAMTWHMRLLMFVFCIFRDRKIRHHARWMLSVVSLSLPEGGLYIISICVRLVTVSLRAGLYTVFIFAYIQVSRKASR